MRNITNGRAYGKAAWRRNIEGDIAVFFQKKFFFSSPAFFCVMVLFSSLGAKSAEAALLDDWQYETIAAGRLYSISTTTGTAFYHSANKACEARMPAPQNFGQTTITYSNPRAGVVDGYGLNCMYHVKYTRNADGVVTDDYPNWFGQGWLGVSAVCPEGMSYTNGVCRVARPPSVGACDKVGNPVFPGRNCKEQIEVDYQSSAASAPLFFTRQYSSWHFMNNVSPLGPNWFIEVFGRYLSTDTNFIVATRALGRTVGFDTNGGVWTPRTDTPDKLESYSDGQGSAWRYFDASRLAYEYYDTSGVLIRIQQLDGSQYTLTYSSSSTSAAIAPSAGLLIDIASSNGSHIALQYNGQGLVSQMVDPAGRIYSYDYSGVDVPTGLLGRVTYPDGLNRQYRYEQSLGPAQYSITGTPVEPVTSAEMAKLNLYGISGTAFDVGYVEQFLRISGKNTMNPLTGIVDEAGIRFATWTYDKRGRPTSTEHAGGVEKYSFVYSGNNVAVTSPLGSANNYVYTVAANRKVLTSITGPTCTDCGAFKSYTYTSNGSISGTTDWNNNYIGYTYNGRGLEISKTFYGGSNPSISTQWDAALPLKSSLTEQGRSTTFTYTSAGQLATKSITDTATSKVQQWSYQYDAQGRLYSIDGPRTDVSDITTLAYDSAGNVSSVTNALGHVTQFPDYDEDGHPLTIQDPNGVITSLAYDARGRVVSSTIESEVTTYEYGPTGLLTKTTLPDGRFLAYAYDDARRLVQVSDQAGNRVDFTLDVASNVISQKVYDQLGSLVQTSSAIYDANNRLQKELDASSQATTLTFDGNKNLTKSVDALGLATNYLYDGRDRLTKITRPDSSIVQFFFNDRSQITTVQDSNNHVTQYSPDAFGNVKSVVSPDTGTTNNTFDNAGNLVSSTDARGAITTYTYDALNRRTQATSTLLGTSVTSNYVYDQGTNGIGRLTSMSDTGSSLAIHYDGHGRVIEMARQISGATLTTNYAYNSIGQLVQITYPSGHTVAYGYNANHTIDSVSVDGQSLVYGISSAPFGEPIGWTWGNGTANAFSLNGDGRFSAYQVGGTSNSLVYDAASRITSIGGSQTIGYDNLSRVTSYLGFGLSQTMTYDANGNRSSIQNGTTSTYTYSTGKDWLASISGGVSRTFGYSATGNIISDGPRAYTYDARNRLVGIGSGVSYSLNGQNQRVQKNVSGTISRFAYDPDGLLEGEYDSSGFPVLETIYLSGRPIGLIKAGSNYYVYSDHLKTPRAVSTSSNTIVWRWDGDAFGTLAASEDPDGDGNLFTYNARFPGQYYDSESGLLYNWNRYYDPSIGRYLQSDPIGLEGGVNTYAYVEGNPVSNTDPTGEFVWGVAFAGADLALQLYENDGNWNCVNWAEVGLSALGGGLLNALGKGAFRFKTVGKHSWDATRKWMNRRGIQLLKPGQHRHHWLLERNQGIGKNVFNEVKNQPWNTNPVSAEFNNWLSRHPKLSWLGAPSWVAEIPAGAGLAAAGIGGDCGCE